MTPDGVFSNKLARAIAGLAALTELLSIVRQEGVTDQDVAKVVADCEPELHALREVFLERTNLAGKL